MAKKCPTCKNSLPFFRNPTSFKQAMNGGWTCQNCESEIDKKGKLIKSKKQREEDLFNEEYVKEKARLKARKESKKERK